MNIKKLTTLAAVGIVSLLSTFQTPTKTYASLTPPTSYDINYSWDATSLRQELGTTSIGGPAPVYTRTMDGLYFNYSTTINNTTHSTILPLGLEITMTFNRSNTNWTTVTGGYIPTENKIGSDNTVGSVASKISFQFDNQTSNDYILHLDLSSTGTGGGIWHDYYNSLTNIRFFFYDISVLRQLYLPSFTTYNLYTSSTSEARYFDAWYLQDLGVSDSYNAGYDQGEIDGYQDGLNNNPNILLNGFQAMVGILVNFFLMIVNLEVFGVSIMGIFSIVVLFVGIVWVLKLIRG